MRRQSSKRLKLLIRALSKIDGSNQANSLIQSQINPDQNQIDTNQSQTEDPRVRKFQPTKEVFIL